MLHDEVGCQATRAKRAPKHRKPDPLMSAGGLGLNGFTIRCSIRLIPPVAGIPLCAVVLVVGVERHVAYDHVWQRQGAVRENYRKESG